VKKLTPVLHVDDLEPELAFWVEGLSFEAVELDEGSVLLRRASEAHGLELILQSRASLARDTPELARAAFGYAGFALRIEVTALEPLLEAIAGAPIIAGPRSTNDATHEIVVKTPSGLAVTFFERVA
jgi:hypothetical protein